MLLIKKIKYIKTYLSKKFFHIFIKNNINKRYNKKEYIKKINNIKNFINIENFNKKIKKIFLKNTIDIKNTFKNRYNNLKKLIRINKEKKIIEIGGGNGIIWEKVRNLIKNIKITITDISKKSIKILKNNIKKFFNNKNIKLKKKNLFRNLKKKNFKTIIFNPPYISYKNNYLKNKKLKFENIISLTDFGNGTLFFKKLIWFLKKIYNIKIIIECDRNYLKYIKYIIKKNKFKIKKIYIDNVKKNRFVKIIK